MSEKLKAFWAKLNLTFKELWEKDKLFLILFGIVIVVIKFRDVLIDILLDSANKVLGNAKKKDEVLASEEDQAKAQADALVKKAKEEANKKPSVDEDWHKK